MYLMGLQMERQLPKNITMFVGAYHMRMIHGIRLRDINAPIPPTFATRPNPALGEIYRSGSKWQLSHESDVRRVQHQTQSENLA